MAKSAQTDEQDDSAARLVVRNESDLAYLRILHGHSVGDVHEVRSTGTSLGRDAMDSACDIRIDDDRMSRQHARIEHDRSSWQLIDLGSRNGGFIDGRSFGANERTLLVDGAVIRLGDTLFVFRTSAFAGEARSTEMAFPGISPVAAAVRRRIGSLAVASGHVLVLGETGTGKERVSRAIGERRAGRPFVTQNCAELTRELARSELFGHGRGAFTGANHSKPGLVELAGDGVLFLDEIGELALEVQGDLLRFLEDGSYRPIGAAELKHSAARVIAATNVDLDQAVASKLFRRDLAARLRASNAPLELPPLRERREDIPHWTAVFLQEAGCPAETVWTIGALECVLLYPWLENLRELRGVIRALLAETARLPFPTERLPSRIVTHRASLRGGPVAAERDEATPPDQELTQANIEEVLRQTQGRVRSAARQLGIDRRKLYRMCERFGIALEDHRGQSQPEED